MSEQILYHLTGEWKRTHRCGELHGADDGRQVILAGWVKRVRELGYLTFLDLWDRTGVVQLVVKEEQPDLHKLFCSLRAEDVIACCGTVRRRPDDMVNPKMKTGEIEVVAERVIVLNRSEVPPFTVTSDVQANEDLRLRFRYLDLRRDPLQRNLELRHWLAFNVRTFLVSEGFLEIETPMLVRRTPEGARDYLVPSRLQPGKFFALPQSPQLYKQILMVAGFDRYFQLARCLRDEDLRADRQPEHTQIDVEMSFVDEEDIFDVTERLMKFIMKETAGVDPVIPFPRMTYEEAINTYGTDKPDLRFGLEIVDCSDLFRDSEFKVFSSIVAGGGVVRGISFPQGADFSRKAIGEFEAVAKGWGAGGLVTVKIDGEGEISSPIARFIDAEMVRLMNERFAVDGATLLLLVGGGTPVVARALGELRNHIGRTYLLRGDEGYRFAWVYRFPLFVPAKGGGWEPAHHIFSMPLEEDISLIEDDPGRVRGHLYDLVCNGTELGSGSIRIHHKELQERVFNVIGIDSEDAQKRFGFLLEAFRYGAPPHGGIALGLDRIAMIVGGGSSIRDYIAFPKTQSATSLMEGAPSEVEEELLHELHIRVTSGNDTE
ncbi:MAG TPA: aspartate--tRNA ligase [Patescibacteria group bacterium]|nr:aspartate--tRNA ligase [Patescibacteria group bacterium]